MNRRRSIRAALAPAVVGIGALLCGAGGVRAAPVTVQVTAGGGAPAVDAVVVFEPRDRVPPPAHADAIIDQIHKRFVPHVTVIRTGTSVTFPNSDRIRHQVYSFSPAKVFSMKLYAGSPKRAVVFDKPGLVVLGCNIHDTMLAFVLVVNTPYFAKIPASGTASFDLPPGRYSMRVWDEALAAPVPARPVVVAAAPLQLSIALDLAGTHDPVAAWP